MKLSWHKETATLSFFVQSLLHPSISSLASHRHSTKLLLIEQSLNSFDFQKGQKTRKKIDLQKMKQNYLSFSSALSSCSVSSDWLGLDCSFALTIEYLFQAICFLFFCLFLSVFSCLKQQNKTKQKKQTRSFTNQFGTNDTKKQNKKNRTSQKNRNKRVMSTLSSQTKTITHNIAKVDNTTCCCQFNASDNKTEKSKQTISFSKICSLQQTQKTVQFVWIFICLSLFLCFWLWPHIMPQQDFKERVLNVFRDQLSTSLFLFFCVSMVFDCWSISLWLCVVFSWYKARSALRSVGRHLWDSNNNHHISQSLASCGEVETLQMMVWFHSNSVHTSQQKVKVHLNRIQKSSFILVEWITMRWNVHMETAKRWTKSLVCGLSWGNDDVVKTNVRKSKKKKRKEKQLLSQKPCQLFLYLGFLFCFLKVQPKTRKTIMLSFFFVFFFFFVFLLCCENCSDNQTKTQPQTILHHHNVKEKCTLFLCLFCCFVFVLLLEIFVLLEGLFEQTTKNKNQIKNKQTKSNNRLHVDFIPSKQSKKEWCKTIKERMMQNNQRKNEQNNQRKNDAKQSKKEWCKTIKERMMQNNQRKNDAKQSKKEWCKTSHFLIGLPLILAQLSPLTPTTTSWFNFVCPKKKQKKNKQKQNEHDKLTASGSPTNLAERAETNSIWRFNWFQVFIKSVDKRNPCWNLQTRNVDLWNGIEMLSDCANTVSIWHNQNLLSIENGWHHLWVPEMKINTVRNNLIKWSERIGKPERQTANGCVFEALGGWDVTTIKVRVFGVIAREELTCGFNFRWRIIKTASPDLDLSTLLVVGALNHFLFQKSHPGLPFQFMFLNCFFFCAIL